jgi:hypothetical protein
MPSFPKGHQIFTLNKAAAVFPAIFSFSSADKPGTSSREARGVMSPHVIGVARPEQHPIRTHPGNEEFEGFRMVRDRIVIEMAQVFTRGLLDGLLAFRPDLEAVVHPADQGWKRRLGYNFSSNFILRMSPYFM